MEECSTEEGQGVFILPPTKGRSSRSIDRATAPEGVCCDGFRRRFEASLRQSAEPVHRKLFEFVTARTPEVGVAVFLTGVLADHSDACRRLIDFLGSSASKETGPLRTAQLRTSCYGSLQSLLKEMAGQLFGEQDVSSTHVSMQSIAQQHRELGAAGCAIGRVIVVLESIESIPGHVLQATH